MVIPNFYAVAGVGGLVSAALLAGYRGAPWRKSNAASAAGIWFALVLALTHFVYSAAAPESRGGLAIYLAAVVVFVIDSAPIGIPAIILAGFWGTRFRWRRFHPATWWHWWQGYWRLCGKPGHGRGLTTVVVLALATAVLIVPGLWVWVAIIGGLILLSATRGAGPEV